MDGYEKQCWVTTNVAPRETSAHRLAGLTLQAQLHDVLAKQASGDEYVAQQVPNTAEN